MSVWQTITLYPSDSWWEALRTPKPLVPTWFQSKLLTFFWSFESWFQTHRCRLMTPERTQISLCTCLSGSKGCTLLFWTGKDSPFLASAQVIQLSSVPGKSWNCDRRWVRWRWIGSTWTTVQTWFHRLWMPSLLCRCRPFLDKCTFTWWFKLNSSSNHPLEIIIIGMRRRFND